MAHMSQEEFLGWMAYSEIEPFGEEREDLRAGIMWSAFVSAHCDPKRYPNGINVDKYPLFAMTKRLSTPPVTSQSLFKTLKMLADASKQKPS